ncbi:MAG TPA: hypothetical protein VNB30_13360 [Rhizomicrobium sp.]|jgi:hypothetical protein|nr:hypothetical protein [Rhizomicrobium sp.]
MSQWTQLSWYVAIALIVIIMGAAAVTLWLIATGDINIKNVLEEPDSDKASLSRFQFLIFTFVVAGLFLLLSIESGTFVAVPNSVLMLLGISAGSYVVSKGITAGAKSTPAGTAAFHAANAAVHATSAAASAESAAASAATAARAAADSVPK